MRSKEFFRLHAEICRSISHPKRLEILSWLREGERNVSELAELMGISPANVSQQLAVLRNSGIVERRLDGTTAYYRITNIKILRAYDLMTAVMEEQIAKGLAVLEEREDTEAGPGPSDEAGSPSKNPTLEE